MEENIPSNLDSSKVSGISPDRDVPRRKSSIFNRRNTFVGDSEKPVCDGSPSEIGRTSESDINLETYINSLKKEVADWETMYKERKKARTLARKRCRLKNVLEKDVFPIFNEEDKVFVQGRQDYNGIGREAIVAMEKFAISLQKATDVEKSSQLAINYIQKTERELRKDIVEFSVLE